MTSETTATAPKQVAINDIGSAEDFLAAVSAMRRERDTARLANEAQLRERIKTRLQRS